MARCAELEKSALEKLGNLVVAATIDAEGANYIENISRRLAKGQRMSGEGGCMGVHGGRRAQRMRLPYEGAAMGGRQPQIFESGRIAAADAERMGYQKWEPMQFPKDGKRKSRVRMQGFLQGAGKARVGLQENGENAVPFQGWPGGSEWEVRV